MCLNIRPSVGSPVREGCETSRRESLIAVCGSLELCDEEV